MDVACVNPLSEAKSVRLQLKFVKKNLVKISK